MVTRHISQIGQAKFIVPLTDEKSEAQVMPKVTPLERARAELGVKLRISNTLLNTLSSTPCCPFATHSPFFCSYRGGFLGQV